MKHTLGLKLSQGLSLTPALQQAIKLLQMSTLDLQTEIQDALDTNLMLEREENEFPGSSEEVAELEANTTREDSEPPKESLEGDGIPDEPPLDYDWSDVYGSSDVASEQALYEFRQANLHSEQDLKSHLQEQAALEDFSPQETSLIDHFIDALDERGYFPDWDALQQQLLADIGSTPEQLEQLRQRLQQWDPAGVGARDLRECLYLQLQLLPPSGAVELAETLIAEHLEALGAETPQRLARLAACTLEELNEAMQLIRQLTPDPGAPFISHEHEYVAPDVYVRKIEGRWLCSINPAIAPKLKINNHYQEMVRRADNSPDQQMLKQHLQEARYFLHSLKSRNETLLKVAQEIVDRQRAFLEYGPEAMRPLVLRDIASKLGVHESTVSRATAHKYLHTPRGLFELKYFFSSAVSTAEGGSCSATAIQAMIRRLVNEESSAKPLSDSRLAQLLKDEGIQVARRTVAKYREGLNIPPSHERKRMA